MSFKRNLATYVVLALFGSTAGSAYAQIPVAFDPCRPNPDESSKAYVPLTQEQLDAIENEEPIVRDLDFVRLCEADLDGPSILISGAASSTHQELLELFAFETVEDISSERVQQIGIVLTESQRYDDISILPDGALVRVSLLEKPRLASLTFEGNTALTKTQLMEITEIEVDSIFDRDAIINQGRTILEIYRELGYFEAAIVPSAEGMASFDAPNGVSVLFTLNEGSIAPISQVSFEGNAKVSDATLRAVVGAANITSADQITEELIQSDQQAIYQKYVEAGLERSVVSASIQTLGENGQPADEENPPRSLGITYLIEEREGFQVGSVGTDDQVDDNVDASGANSSLTQGETFDPEAAQVAAQELAAQLNEESDKDLGVRTEFEVDEDTGKVDVNFVVFEVPPREVISVRFSGNTKTAAPYLASLFDIPVGSFVSRKDVLAGAQRIADAGLFENVSVEEDDAPAGKAALNVVIEESKTGTQRIGAALSSLYGFSINGGIEERNWLGYGLFAGVAFDLAEDRQLIRAFFEDTTWRDTDVRLSTDLSLQRNFNDSLDYATYSATLTGSLTDQIDEITSQSASLTLNLSQIEEVGPLASPLAVAAQGRLDTSLALRYQIRRNNIEGGSTPVGGSDLYFNAGLTVSDNEDPYLSLGAYGARYWSLNEAQSLVFSTRASLDHVVNLEGGQVPLSGRIQDPSVPVRGFAFSGIAPREVAGGAVGGSTAVGSSVQLRYQLLNNERFPIYGTAFVDAGAVFDEGNFFVLNTSGGPVNVNDSDSLRLSAGIGVTLVTSGGTVTLSYAEPFVSEGFDQIEEFQFTLGTNF